MGGELPKQYLPLHGKTVIEHTLERFCTHPRISGIVVATARDDPHWEALQLSCSVDATRVEGGAERCHSVLNALAHLETWAGPDDWVLVHDAARPCVRRQDIDRLMETLADHEVGGLLGIAVRDTMKRSNAEGEVYETVGRDRLWHAVTPQMFRLGALKAAMVRAVDAGVLVTDEAAAMERSGARPQMVPGHADNIKITLAEDLALAAFFLAEHERLLVESDVEVSDMDGLTADEG